MQAIPTQALLQPGRTNPSISPTRNESSFLVLRTLYTYPDVHSRSMRNMRHHSEICLLISRLSRNYRRLASSKIWVPVPMRRSTASRCTFPTSTRCYPKHSNLLPNTHPWSRLWLATQIHLSSGTMARYLHPTWQTQHPSSLCLLISVTGDLGSNTRAISQPLPLQQPQVRLGDIHWRDTIRNPRIHRFTRVLAVWIRWLWIPSRRASMTPSLETWRKRITLFAEDIQSESSWLR